MPSEPLHMFDPPRTIQLQGFSGRAATTTIHDATETGFQISGIFQAAEDFANIQLFSAYDYYNHMRLKPLPVTDLSGVTLQLDMQVLQVNGEEGNVRPDCVKYPSVGWDKLTITTGNGDIYEVPLMAHCSVLSGGFTPGSFEIALEDKKVEDLDALVGGPTPALTDAAYVYFMGTRWSCNSAEAIAFCGLETRLLNNIGALDVPSCEQALWWQDDPNFWHYLLVNGGGAGIRESGATDAADIASRLASMVGISSYLVDCSASGNVITVSLEAGVNGPVRVSTNSGSAPATLTRFVPGIYTAQVASSAEIRAGDYVGIDIGTAHDEVVKAISAGGGSFTAYFKKPHYGKLYNITCRVLPRARHFGRTLKDRMVDRPAPDYGEQPASLAISGFATTNTSAQLSLRLAGQMGEWGREANGIPVRQSVKPENAIVALSGGVTSSASMVQGARNDRTYRFQFPFGALAGYKNGDRQSLVAVPVTDIVKVHVTFAPRFEDVEFGLANGGFLLDAVPASPVGTQEEWRLANAQSMSAGTKYYVGNATTEERITCLANFGLVKPDPEVPGTWYCRVLVRRGEDSSVPQAWSAGTPVQWISTITGTRSDVEWQVAISNITLSGPTALKVGGPNENDRLEETKGATYVGYWEEAPYGAGWWSGGHAKRCAPSSANDLRRVTVRYQRDATHDLYVGTWLGTSAGKIQVVIDGGAPQIFDLYLNDYNGLAAMKKIGSRIAPGSHVVEITALFDKNPASTGYFFYYDYLWPLVPQDVPDAPEVYENISLAIDFDTDHGYKKPPAWHVWHLEKLGFRGHADVYMGVFWNNKRRRVEATYPNCTVSLGAWQPDEPLWINLSGTTLYFSPGAGLSDADVAGHLRAMLNVTFPGVWCTSSAGGINIRSRAPGYTFSITTSTNLSVVQGTPSLSTPGTEGDWEMIDTISPVMTQGARNWIRNLSSQLHQAGIPASFAFSMECYRPPVAMAGRYWDGAPVDLPVPSTQMHFGPRVRAYLKQMYKECADQLAAAGLPIVLQFGETQWWYFPNDSGMPFYDDRTKADFFARFGRPMHRFVANTDDPAEDQQTADFLRDRIWEYCSEVIDYVRRYHPSAVFECLWPLDANQGKPAPNASFRRLNMHVNLPEQWKSSGYGVKYFRAEGFDYDVRQKSAVLMKQTMRFPLGLGRPGDECMYLAGIFGAADPPYLQAYSMWKQTDIGSLCLWAFDQFCLNSRPVPLTALTGRVPQSAIYHKPRAVRAEPVVIAVPFAPPADGALNRFPCNSRGLNG
ncbi:MAG: hypothetical protein JSU00_25715 [Acidobacteria bacterium]|nr:hypothetical protein [Acidobacteriota bacterium]